MKKAYVIGTCDTKFKELSFVKTILQEAGIPSQLLDVSTQQHAHSVDVTAADIASCHPSRKDLLTNNEGRGDAITAMSEALEVFLQQQKDLGGLIGLGGSGGTALICKGLRSLPVGLPKIMVSTVASGQVAPYVGGNDICMMYSVTDIAGINQISNLILSNAAHALIGMMSYPVSEWTMAKPPVGMTMFGVTTPCVNFLRSSLESSYDCLVFHATGTGGQSMEKLIDSGLIHRVLDVTLTEVCDLLMGGIMSAGEDRLGAVIRQKMPYVGSVGALDMVNFGGMPTVPEKYKNRLLYQHNAQVTLMRTTKAENILMGQWIAKKLNQMEGPVRFFLPEKGTSLLSVEGQAFYDPEADAALIATMMNEVKQTKDRKMEILPFALNEEPFAEALLKGFREI
ncbi:MAG: Tm-1-like ATP-binding domain-containing protein [Saprospiraceae bacterium]